MLTPFQLGKPNEAQVGIPPLGGPANVERHIAAIKDAMASGQPLQPVMLSIMADFGFEHFAYAITTAAYPTRDSRSFVWTTMPWQWMAEYDQKAYVEVDPRITKTWGRSAPFVWDSTDFANDPKIGPFLADAARYGTRSGVAISFSDPAYTRIGVAYNSSISPVDPVRKTFLDQRLGDLMMFAARFHDLFVANYVDQNALSSIHGAPLSPRERECLALAARGMTSLEIGTKLGIAERTANFH